jgi:hypothetical protein
MPEDTPGIALGREGGGDTLPPYQVYYVIEGTIRFEEKEA